MKNFKNKYYSDFFLLGTRKRLFSSISHLNCEEQEKDIDYNDNNLDYKKTYYKNDLRKQVLKQNFDKDKIFTNVNILSEQDKKLKERVDICDENKQLQYDSNCIDRAIKTVASVCKNKIPRKKDFDAYRHITETYDSFFDDSDIHDITQIDEIEEARGYIKEELKINKARLKISKEQLYKKSDEKSLKRKLDDINEYEESERSTKSMSVDKESTRSMSVDKESTKSMSIDRESPKSIGEESEKSSTKSPGTVSDYIDSLPSEYNPFDDVGTD